MLWSPDTRVPCYFSSLQLPLGWILPDPGPWEKKRKIIPEKKKVPFTHTQLSQPRIFFFKKRKSGRNDMTCLSTDPSPSPCQPDVSQLPFV